MDRLAFLGERTSFFEFKMSTIGRLGALGSLAALIEDHTAKRLIKVTAKRLAAKRELLTGEA